MHELTEEISAQDETFAAAAALDPGAAAERALRAHREMPLSASGRAFRGHANARCRWWRDRPRHSATRGKPRGFFWLFRQPRQHPATPLG